MYQRVIYLIKHNSFIRKLFILIGSLALRFLGIFVPIDDKMILFVSNIGKNYSGSPKEIYEYMKANDKYGMYRYVWAFEHPENYSDFDAIVIKFDTFTYFIYALRAKYWITDVNIERSLNFKKSKTKYLNTWHGIALKKIGNDHKASGKYDYSKIDFLCVSGEYDKKVFSSALNASSKAFLECGMPRNDSLYFADDEQKEYYRDEIGIPKGKKIILYAPTWRESTNKGKSYDLNLPVDFNKWEGMIGKDYVVLFRAHDRITKVMDIQYNDFVIDVSSYEPLNKLLIIADILITDYSSIVFDYSILNKPFICFCHDFEKYVSERGLYFNPEQVYPGGVMKTEDEVLNRILNFDYEEEKSKIPAFREQFIQYGTLGNATEKCVKAMFG